MRKNYLGFMQLLKINLLLGLAATFLLTGCSSDDLNEKTQSLQEEGVLSNDEIILTYGEAQLAKFMEMKNEPLKLKNQSSTKRSLAVRAVEKEYSKPDLTNAIDLTTQQGTIMPQPGKVYFIPEGKTFSGVLAFSQPATIYVLGTWKGNTYPVTVPDGAKIVVAPTGELKAQNFSLHGAKAELENYGSVDYTDANVTGKIRNYGKLNFVSKNVQFNPQSDITNFCRMNFTDYVRIESSVDNYGQIEFANGFVVQHPSGELVLHEGSVSNINKGNATYSGPIKNAGKGFARINVQEQASLKSTHQTGTIGGAIDVNGNVNKKEINLKEEATYQADVYIAGTQCVTEQGEAEPTCTEEDLNLTLIASLKSPKMNEITLSATDVKIVDGFAYLSYHTNDEVYGDIPNGAIRIVDVRTATSPKLVNEAAFTNAEFNGLTIESDQLFAVGGNKAGARLITSPLEKGIFNKEDLGGFQTYKLAELSAKNAYVADDFLWVTSGANQGSISQLDITDDFNVLDKHSLKRRAKYVVHNEQYQVAMSLDEAGVSLRIAGIDGSGAKRYDYIQETMKPSVTDGKNVMAIDEEYVYLALSDKGVAKVRLDNGNLEKTFEPNKFEKEGSKVFKGNGWTNAVAVKDCYLYLANGNDGVIILNKETFDYIDSFELDKSSNYIYIKDNLMFVATGRDGLNIIKLD